MGGDRGRDLESLGPVVLRGGRGDHEGRLGQLEERLVSELQDRTGSGVGTEQELSHLDVLRVRLDDVGLARGDLTTRRPSAGRSDRHEVPDIHADGLSMRPCWCHFSWTCAWSRADLLPALSPSGLTALAGCSDRRAPGQQFAVPGWSLYQSQ